MSKRTRKPAPKLAQVIQFPRTPARRCDDARAALRQLVTEPRDVARLPEYWQRYDEAMEEIATVHAIAAGPLVAEHSDGRLERLERAGDTEAFNARAFLAMVERETRTAEIIDLASYRRARAQRAS